MYKNCIHRGYRLKDCRNAEISERKIIAALYRRIMDPEFGGVIADRRRGSSSCYNPLSPEFQVAGSGEPDPPEKKTGRQRTVLVVAALPEKKKAEGGSGFRFGIAKSDL